MSEKKHELIIAALGLVLIGTIIICAAFDTKGNTEYKTAGPDVISVTGKQNSDDIPEKSIEPPEEQTVQSDENYETQPQVININTASAEELTALNNIGIERAESIVEYREEYGGFDSVEELTNIYGIGENTLEEIRDYISVE